MCLFTDQGNKLIRKVVLKTGETSTILKESTLVSPNGLAIVENGAVAIVSDAGTHALYKISVQTGQVEHLSGIERLCNNNCGPTYFVFRDGSSSESLFNSPSGLAYDASTNSLIVADTMNHALRRVQLSDGRTTTIAGRNDGCEDRCSQAYYPTYLEGQGRSAAFNRPTSVAVSPDGAYAVVADTYNLVIRRVDLRTGMTSLLARSNDLSTTSSFFAFPEGVALNKNGKMLYIADTLNNRICSFNTETKQITVLAGPGPQSAASGTDGVGTAASFSQPTSLTLVSSDDWLVVADSVSHRIRMLPLTPGAWYEPNKGFEFCPACPPGTFSGAPGAACETCAENKYSNGGAESCSACPEGSTTQGAIGSTNISACVCDETRYPGIDVSTGQMICLVCPAAARCPDGTCAFRNKQSTCGTGSAAKPILGTWRMKSGRMSLVDCPPGSLVVNASTDTQTCFPCDPGTYSFNPTDNCGKDSCIERSCNPCPVGAQCAGGSSFRPLVQGSVWEKVRNGDTIKMRLKTCPAGHVLVRSEDRPENDECVKCLSNTYMAEQASYETGKGVSKSAAVLQDGLNLCLTCPTGSICSGKEEVNRKLCEIASSV
jgi:sugar lactone lactonase YvrE